MLTSGSRGKRTGRRAGLICLLAAFAAQPAIAGAGQGERWILVGLYSHGWLTGGRDDWNVTDSQLLYRATPKLILGGHLVTKDRGAGTDALYGTLFSFQASPTLEWHGAMAFAPDSDFSPLQQYTTGLKWRTARHLSLLADVERENFPEGPVDQVKPGISWWFSDRTSLTARYVFGRAFHDENFDAVALKLNLGLPEDRRLSLGFAHGTDPEKDPAVPGVILTSANLYTIYYRTPLRSSLDLIVGAEYEDRRDIYRRTTATLGFVWEF